jgi:uncharacterized repeat protein (TIGR01451 family)
MKKLLAVLVTILLLLPSLATAAQKGVELSSRAEVEVSQKNDKGETVLQRVAADKANVAPGDTVIFTIAYSNKGERPAENIVINNPIPEHMTYTDSSAEGTGTRIEYSVDNGKSYGQLATLLIKTAAGKEKPATAADITAVRWTLEKPLAAGAGGSVSYRAKVK